MSLRPQNACPNSGSALAEREEGRCSESTDSGSAVKMGECAVLKARRVSSRESVMRNAMIAVSTCLFGLNAQTVLAQSSLANDPARLASEAISEAGGVSKPVVMSGQLILGATRTADEAQPISYAGSYMGVLSAVHPGSRIAGTLRVAYSQEYTYADKNNSTGTFENPSLSLSRSWAQGKHFESSVLDSLSLTFSGVVGANDESARRNFLWSNGLSLTATKTLGRWTAQQSIGYSRGFYEYETRRNGVINSPDTFKGISTLIFGLSDRVSVGATYSYAYSVSFQGVGRVATIADTSVEYALSDRLAASVGVSVERGTLEPDGQSNRIRFFAPEAAQYVAQLTLLL